CGHLPNPSGTTLRLPSSSAVRTHGSACSRSIGPTTVTHSPLRTRRVLTYRGWVPLNSRSQVCGRPYDWGRDSARRSGTADSTFEAKAVEVFVAHWGGQTIGGDWRPA